MTKVPDPPASTWKSRLETSGEEPDPHRFGLSKEKLPYFRTVEELKASDYDFRRMWK